MRFTTSWAQFKEHFPRLRKLAADSKTVASAILSGQHVEINVFLEERRLHKYQEVIEVRQSRRSERRWAYIPGRIPPGEYRITFNYNKNGRYKR